MRPETEEWYARHTWHEPRWRPEELAAAKTGPVSVVLPALNEAATVGDVVTAVRPLLGTLVDEIVVVDSGSTDATAAVAARAGARVVHREDVLAEHAVRPGKGEVLWRSLSATRGDHVVFLDADLVGLGADGPRFVTALLGPLLTVEGVALVKGFYRRPPPGARGSGPGPDESGPGDDDGGGRVTELVARPVLAALRPELAGVVQPLGGEYAGSRELLESLPFAAGYGVEIGLLLDTHRARGLDAIAQVDLGVRDHRHRSLRALGPTAAEVLDAALRRCADRDPDDLTTDALTQFRLVGGEWVPDPCDVAVTDRPPVRELAPRP